MPNGDDLEYVNHPTLGLLKFPKSMPQAERDEAVDHVVRQKYNLPEGTNLHQQQLPEGVDANAYRNAFYEANYGGGEKKPAAAPGAARAETPPSTWGDTIVSRGLRAGADYLTRKEKEAETADQAAAARGEQPGMLRRAGRFARTFYGGSLADAMRTGAGMTTPRALAELGGAAVMPTVGTGYFLYQGAAGARDAYRKGQEEGWTPENVQNLLMSLGTAGLAGAGLRAATTGARIPRAAETRVAPEARPAVTPPRAAATPARIPEVTARPGVPSAGEPLDAVAQMRFGKPYDALTHEQQVDIVRGIGARQEAPLLQEQRTGQERRMPTATAPPGAIPPVERRVGQERRIPLTPQSTDAEIEAEARRQVDEQRSPDMPRTNVFQDFNEENRRRINEAIAQEQGTVPPRPPEQRITPVRKPPPQPGTPERPPPTEESDPLKREFPDPAVRRFARANGPELVRATEGDPESLQMVHDLTNVEIRQAALNAGIELGTKHVGTRIGLGPEQVSRQELIAQMLREGNSPRDIVRLAQTEQIGYQRTMPIPPGKMVRAAGMSTLQILHHELAHAILAGLDGIDVFGIWSHRHPKIARGAGAATVVDLSQFKYQGQWSAARIGGKLYGILEMLTAGAAIDEALHNIPRYENPGVVGDLGMVKDLLNALGISPHLHGTIYGQMVDRALERLAPFHDLIREEGGRREENLPVEFHASKERLDKIIQRARDIRDAAERARAEGEAGAGAAPGGAEAAHPGGEAVLAGREGRAAPEGAGVRAAPEKLKPFRAPQNTYRFKVIENVGGQYREYEMTLDAPNVKKAIDKARVMGGLGWRQLHLLSETKPQVEQIPMQVAPEVRRATPEDIKTFSPKTQKFFQRFLGLLTQDEARWLSTRPIQQRNIIKAFQSVKPTFDELVNIAKAGEPFGGWWQRFIDTFRTLGKERYAAQMERVPFSDLHEGRLKAIHSSLSGNKAVAQANDAAWIAYHDWLERGGPTNKPAINSIVKNARAISGFRGLDTVKMYKLVNSPEWRGEKPFSGEVFSPESPIQGKTSGARKLPSMLGGTAGEGNWLRIVFDTHMKDLFGLLGLTDSHYVAMSMHIRAAADHLGLPAMEAQGQMWGVILGLKQLMKEGMTPGQAARAFGLDVMRQVGKDYAQTVLERQQVKEGMTEKQIAKANEVREAMAGMKEYGLDALGNEALDELEKIVESGQRRLAQPMRRISRVLLERSARRIQRNLAARRRLKVREVE